MSFSPLPDDYSTTPDSDTPPSPDEEIANLEAQIGETAPDIVIQEEPLPAIGRSCLFDFNTRRIIAPGGTPLATQGDQTLALWCIAALRTARGAHAIYPEDYGRDDPSYPIGTNIGSIDEAIIESDVRDTLTFHPRVVDVQEFSLDMDADDDGLFMSFRIVKDDGDYIPVSNVPVNDSTPDV